MKKIPGVVVKNVDIAKCNNPTFSKDGTNTLAKNAPYPQACDKVGKTQCTGGTGGATEDTPGSGGGAKPSTSASAAVAGAGDSGAAADPDTGLAAGGGGRTGADSALAVPVSVGIQLDSTLKTVLIALACALLVGLTVGPPLIARAARKGDKR